MYKNIKYNKLVIVGALLFIMLASSCSKFLEVNPNSSLEVNIDSEEKIAELLTGAYPDASYFDFLETRTDNVGERDKGVHSLLNESMFFWEDYDQEDLDTPLNYWNSCYRGIAQANKALELLVPYEKTPRVKALYGEAFLLRAYLHFMLVNIWSDPYATYKSETSPGIPYLTKPEKHALVDYKRGTVKEVYEKIEKDLKLGITLVDDSYYTNPKFHFNKRAAYAFASRFYLMKGEWEQVIAYSDYVLGSNPQKYLRNWQNETNSSASLYERYNVSSSPSVLLLTSTESRFARNLPVQKYGPTIKGIDKIYNKTGIDGASKDWKKIAWQSIFPFLYTSGKTENGMYLAKFSEMSLYGSGGNKPRGLYVLNTLFSVEEVMLNRMEAYAMIKEYDKAIDELILYMVRKLDWDSPVPYSAYLWTKSTNSEIYTPFYGLTLKQLALVKTITEMRQKEFLHEGLRWFDIRRFYLPVKRNTKNPLYHPLMKEDSRKLLQIPIDAINRGLEPNPRSYNYAGFTDGLPNYVI